MIRYLLVDEEGQLHEKQADDYRAALADVGPEGWDRVSMRSGFNLAGYLNDCGLLFPDRYRRNVVGACMLVSLTAVPRPYAGPLVLTGWNDRAAGVEVCSLDDVAIGVLQLLHGDVRKVLGLDQGDLAVAPKPGWAAELRRYAEWMQDAPFQGPVILGGQDAIDFMRRGRR